MGLYLHLLLLLLIFFFLVLHPEQKTKMEFVRITKSNHRCKTDHCLNHYEKPNADTLTLHFNITGIWLNRSDISD